METFFEVLLAHPVWSVTEAAAAALASLADENPDTCRHIEKLFDHKLWRVQYGAAEASFLARFTDRNQLFQEAIGRFYKHPEPLLKGDIAENLAAWILDSNPLERRDLLRTMEQPLGYWLRNEEEDCWVLDHVYRLFRTLTAEGYDEDCNPLLAGGVSHLLDGDPVWYSLDRQSFLRRIEERRRNRDNRSTPSA